MIAVFLEEQHDTTTPKREAEYLAHCLRRPVVMVDDLEQFLAFARPAS